MMDHDTVSKNVYILDNSRRWVKEANMKGVELLNIVDKSFDLGGSFDNFKLITDSRLITQYYFILALHRSLEWLKQGKKIAPEFEKFFFEIEKIPYLEDIRNMHEHEQEYAIGKGRDRERFFYEDKERSYVSDATGSIGTIDGKYRIGGRLIVQDAISICERILPEIEQVIEKYQSNY
ncbi:hypothetical protein [Paenibacillus sp. GP183]|jgi:hypothetical protein|uniref:hypothetical protein n=1 Tax=Paenibacillus sp. GP183 TaxID=1882751 RepID=UPI0008997138|nr:hypothetical protein [Paenibacillus sp. GP183]SEC42840.1 hypothetical protein SAMN05443246_4080 [Paenibacillus sp. GP183]